MARKKSTETIEAEINKVKSDMSRLQDRYDKLADKLKGLQEEKRRIEADVIMDAYLKSDKSLDEIITFLNP
jgi:predicted  nucleic acid-binding Zn-ribbon protein